MYPIMNSLGSLVKAVRSGSWLLLDEINLASPETLEAFNCNIKYNNMILEFKWIA
jgi:midasin (ATPase involved in ribosome maturation)